MSTTLELGSKRRPCGCIDLHDRGCPLVLTVIREPQDTRLPVAHEPFRSPLPLMRFSTEHTDWTSHRLVPDGAILAPEQLGLAGFWQRQGTHLVPITSEAYAAVADQCEAGPCRVCRDCTTRRARLERRIVDAQSAVDTVAAIRYAIVSSRTVIDRCAAPRDDTSMALDYEHAAECTALLAGLVPTIRHAERILSTHRATLERDCASLQPPNATRR